MIFSKLIIIGDQLYENEIKHLYLAICMVYTNVNSLRF